MADPVEPVPEVEPPAETLAAQYDAESEATQDETPRAPTSVPSPPEESAAPPAVPHPKYLVQLALDHGFSDEEISSYSSEQLGSAVYHLQKQARELARQTAHDRETQRALERPREGSSGPPPPEPETGPAEEGLGLDETQYDPGLINAFKKQQLQLKLLKEKLSHLDSREQARANQTMTERVDAAFGKHEGTLGKGARRDLDVNSPEYARRMAILGMVDRDTSHRSLEEKIDRAVEVLYGQSPQPSSSAPTPELSRQQRRWQEGAVARPTHRVADAEQPGVKKATKAVAEKLASLSGGPTDNGEADESDFLG